MTERAGPGQASRGTPLRELSKALFALADRLASDSEINRAGADQRPFAQLARDEYHVRDAFTRLPDAGDA